jgi:hypothetical protein
MCDLAKAKGESMFRFILSFFLYLGITYNASAIECENYMGSGFYSPYAKLFGYPNTIYPGHGFGDNLSRKGEPSIRDVLDIIVLHGTEKYLEGALNGAYPLEFNGMTERNNALDFALMHRVRPELIGRLRDSGLSASLYYWRVRFLARRLSPTVIDEYLLAGKNVNDIKIKYMNLGGFALAKNHVELLAKFLRNGGDLYSGKLVDTSNLSIESRLKFSDLVDFDVYNKKYQQQQKDRLEFEQKPIDNPEYSYFHSTSCEKLNDWTIEQKEITQIIRQAVENCPKNKLKCIQKISPVVAEIHMRRELFIKLSKFKAKQLEKVDEFHLLDEHSLGSFKWDQLAYEKFLVDKTLHLYPKKDIEVIKLYRLSKIGRIIADNKELTEYLMKTMPYIKDSFYLGKNLAYFVTLESDSKEYLEWFYKQYGSVNQLYGINYYTANLIESISIPSLNQRTNLYKKMGFKENEFDISFRERLVK